MPGCGVSRTKPPGSPKLRDSSSVLAVPRQAGVFAGLLVISALKLGCPKAVASLLECAWLLVAYQLLRSPTWSRADLRLRALRARDVRPGTLRAVR